MSILQRCGCLRRCFAPARGWGVAPLHRCFAPARGWGVAPLHRYHAHYIAIFLAKERDRAAIERVLIIGRAPAHQAVGANPGVEPLLDLAELRGLDRARVGEVEAQSIGRDQRASLGRMFTNYIAQHTLEHMGRRVVALNIGPPRRIDRSCHRIANSDDALLDDAIVDEEARHGPQCILNAYAAVGANEQAAIADLATTLSVKGRSIERDLHLLAARRTAQLVAASEHCQDLGRSNQLGIASEDGGLKRLFGPKVGLGPALKLGRLAPTLALSVHQPIVGRRIHT